MYDLSEIETPFATTSMLAPMVARVINLSKAISKQFNHRPD